MPDRAEIAFVKMAQSTAGSAVVLAGVESRMGEAARALESATGGQIARASAAAKFTGKALKSVQILAPASPALDRIVVIGVDGVEAWKPLDWLKLGGTIPGCVSGEGDVTVLLERPDGAPVTADQAADVALGISLRSYAFERYKTKRKNGEEIAKSRRYLIALADPKPAQKLWSSVASAVADGVAFARDLVNEPANVLGPVEFAEQLSGLSSIGVEVEVFDETRIAAENMRALIGVAQGSERPPRVVVMHWRGAKGKAAGKSGAGPVAMIGKGVVFDSGGISIKPAGGMEDMKGDMAGAAAVAGLMHALASRKAKVNVVGIVGLVENMPDGRAQRPGDIVTSLSGQTIEIINTDAEGRLVLADLLTYIQRTEKPVAMIDLATLTGAIIVALGQHHAGLFSNDDRLAGELLSAGQASGEKVWRMPLGPEYDKLMDSKVADMKNAGGRHAGSVTAAQFLQRFVENDTPWAHLDVAGTAMGAPSSETNQSWGSGFGVRLLDEFLRARFERG